MNPLESITASLLAAFPGLDAADITLVSPPSLELGDIAVPMFLPARRLKMAPPALAAQAKTSVHFGPEVASVTVAGPYLNIKLDRSLVGRYIVGQVLAQGDRFGSNRLGRGKRVVIEHTSINPNASPHVGRARCAMIGDSLARLLRFEGHEVEVHYYVNDMGRQIGLLVLIADELERLTFDQVLNAYVRANARAEQDEEFAARGYTLLARMEEGDPEAQRKFRAVTDLCLKGQLEVLARIGAAYDVFDHESSYVKDARLEPVLAALHAREALFTDEDQRLVVDLAKLGYEQEEGRFFVLMRANGSSLYGYRDLAYTIDKRERGADIDLIVLGEDHKLYFQQISMILAAAGHPAPEPIYYSYILLKEGKMATRQGKGVLLADFLDRGTTLAAERVADQCTDLSPEEQQAIARQVAVAAIRFAVLRVNANKNVTFDMDAALSFQGDTGPYIQYSCARINSILRKHPGHVPDTPTETFQAETDAEWALLAKLGAFPSVLAAALEQRMCAPIAVYALEVAHLFTTFYHECPVLTADTPEQIQARLHICRAARQTLVNALGILGIDAPERM